MHRRLSLIFGALLACTSDAQDPHDAITPSVGHAAPPPPEPNLSTLSSPEPEPEQTVAPDFYADATSWCEPMLYDTPCETDTDCAEIEHVSMRPLRCLLTRRSKRENLHNEKGEPQKFCAIGAAGRLEQAWRRARLREIVAQSYFNETDHCPAWEWELSSGRRPSYALVWDNGRPVHKQHYRCQREWRAAELLTAFLWVVYGREVGGQPWRRHRLDPDEKANTTAWVKVATDYGWNIDLVCANGRSRCKNADKEILGYEPSAGVLAYNPFYGARHRWQYGLGPYGKNTAYGVQDWDKLAPPEILCLEVPGTEAYLRDARHAVAVFRGQGVQCGVTTYRGRALQHTDDGDVWTDEPSWLDVHRVASGGKYCPHGKETKTRARLEEAGIDPDQPVTLDMLGAPVPRETQNEHAAQVLDHLDDVLPAPWLERG